jgi:hypothetical protein
MQPYINTIRRYGAILALALALIWVPGILAAIQDYLTTFESSSTIWVQRTTVSLSSGANDPAAFGPMSPGNAQAEIFGQLLQTANFLEQVTDQTSLARSYAAAADKEKFLADLRKRFRAEALGTNLIRISYRANEPGVAAEMVTAALNARDARVRRDRLASSAASVAFYQKEYDIAQAQVTTTQKEFDRFNELHPAARLTAAEEYTQSQLRVAVDLARAQLSELRARIELASVSTSLLDLTESVDYNIIDRPRIQTNPSGGLRSAATTGGVAIVGGLALVVAVVVLLTVLNDRVMTASDLGRIARVPLFATVARVPQRPQSPHLRSALASSLQVESAPGPRVVPEVSTA